MKKKKQNYDLLWARWVRKYPGKYIAVVDNKVMAVGKSRLLAFKKMEKMTPTNKEIALLYIPSPKQYPMLTL